MRNMMFLPPGKLLKEFTIEECVQTLDSITTNGRPSGRPSTVYEKKEDIIKGVLAKADPHQKWRWDQLGHPISHIIVQNGRPKAKEEDRLICDGRVFVIQGVDDCGGLGIAVQYFTEERYDLK